MTHQVYIQIILLIVQRTSETSHFIFQVLSKTQKFKVEHLEIYFTRKVKSYIHMLRNFIQAYPGHFGISGFQVIVIN